MLLNLYDAKMRLSALVEEAAAGKEIIIAKTGKPRARLVALRPATRRQPGRAKGKIWMSGTSTRRCRPTARRASHGTDE